MRLRRREPGNFALMVAGIFPGLVAILALGACGLETIVAPEAAMEAPQAAVDSNETTESPQDKVEPGETAEASTAAGDWLTEGSSGTAIIVCRRQPSPLYRADTP